jgi:hypothetical protein
MVLPLWFIKELALRIEALHRMCCVVKASGVSSARDMD